MGKKKDGKYDVVMSVGEGLPITLGHTYVDSITGFRGVATARTQYLAGNARVCIEPKIDKEGKVVPEQWIDEHRLNEA